ncbi:hypothetical protein [Nitrosospira briensis]|uniref:hypothetical protein n=1 Tax=Nitrosospira briensis TaxID=35799 RepID=UPI0008E1ADBB|nr:hypothetical protein [Nitrosospira briensis]SFO37383.1 hypothetical protein SAMN05216332_11287 [Nitrosospira briensis]
MKSALSAIVLLAGCGSIADDYKPVRTQDGSRVYSITSLYDGSQGAREQAIQWLDINARNLCLSEYALLSEETVPIMNRVGEVISSRLIWEIECMEQSAAPSP